MDDDAQAQDSSFVLYAPFYRILFIVILNSLINFREIFLHLVKSSLIMLTVTKYSNLEIKVRNSDHHVVMTVNIFKY